MMKRLLFFFLFCSLFSCALQEKIVVSHSSYVYDELQNPIALKIVMRQTIIPIVDGIKMEWQKEERWVEQSFPIYNQTKIANQKTSPPVQIAKSTTTVSHQHHMTSPRLLQSQKQNSRFYTDIKMVPHHTTAFESMSNREILAAMLYDRYCLIWYHMNSSQKYKMMELGYKKFEQKLLSDQTLQDWAVLELWNEYKAKRMWNVGEQKQMREQSIKHALDCRQKNHQNEAAALFDQIVQQEKTKAEQALWQSHKKMRLERGEIIQARYEALKKISQEYGIYLHGFFEKGDQALDAAKARSFEQYEVRYELDDQTRGYLFSKNIDYKELLTFFGTDLQQEYHVQICQLFKDAALLQAKLFHESDMLAGVCHVGVAAHEANKKEWTDVTGVLSIIGSKLLSYSSDAIDSLRRFGLVAAPYGIAVAQGVLESATDFVHMAIHPGDTLYGIGKLIYFVMQTAAFEREAVLLSHQFNQASGDPFGVMRGIGYMSCLLNPPDTVTAAACFANKDKIIAQVLQRRAEIAQGLELLVEHCEKMDGPARVKAFTKFGADFVIPGKITGACAHLLGGVCLRAKGLRKIEGVMGMLSEDFGAERALEFAAEAAGKIAHEDAAFTEILTEFLEAENQLSKVSRVARSLKEIVDEIRNVHKGVIPFHCHDLKKELELVLAEIKKSLKVAATEKLKKLYKKKVIDGKQVEIFFDHIFEAEFKFKKCSTKGGHILEIKGGHLSGMCEKLEQAGIAKIVKKEVLSCNSVEYTMQNAITGEIYSKRVFPPCWGEEKIAKSICEVYETGIIEYTSKKVPYKTKQIDQVNVSIFYKEIIQEIRNGNPDICNIITAVPYGNIR